MQHKFGIYIFDIALFCSQARALTWQRLSEDPQSDVGQSESVCLDLRAPGFLPQDCKVVLLWSDSFDPAQRR